MWSKILAAECLSWTSLSKGGSLEKSISALICVLTTTALFSGCGGNQQFETVLSDETVSAGIDFWHDNGMSGELYFAETVGPGVALFDWDSDGDMDVAFSQGYLLKSSKSPEPTRLLTPPSGFESGFRLYRNDSLTSGAPKFTDITSHTGIQSRVYGMGLAITDFNRDGQPDVLITGLGEDEFWVSTDSGQYSNRAPELGINDDRWTTSAIFADLDRDGDEDLYVCAYVDFSLDNHKPCFGPNSVVDYCGPSSFPSLPDRLYENMGSHALRDITSESGIGAVPGAGLGVVCSDLDQDGSMDLYVANDGEANRQWRQDSRLHFVDTALLSGCALNRDGRPEASMGADLGDFDGDGDEDIFLTHLDGETNTLYENLGSGQFDDISVTSGLGIPSRKWTGFGTAWFDVDNDGWLDLYVTNGAVKRQLSLVAQGIPHPLGQPDQIYRNVKGQKFEMIPYQQLPALQKMTVGRGAALGDIDNDGDVDIVTTGNGESARVLVNHQGSKNAWFGVKFEDSKGVTLDGVDFKVVFENGETLHRRSRRGGSYLSSHDPRVVVGLGQRSEPFIVVVEWPHGNVEKIGPLTTGKYHTLKEKTP